MAGLTLSERGEGKSTVITTNCVPGETLSTGCAKVPGEGRRIVAAGVRPRRKNLIFAFQFKKILLS